MGRQSTPGWRGPTPPPTPKAVKAARTTKVRTLPKVRRPVVQLAALEAHPPQGGHSMKFYVRHANGGELMFPSFKDFQTMYRLQFVAPDDMVRRENSERWVRAGDLPELRVALAQSHGPSRKVTQAVWLAVGIFALLMLFQLFFRLKPLTLDNPPPAKGAPSKVAH